MDGEVIIPVDLDTKRFDRQIDKVEDELFQIDEKLKHARELKLSEKDVVKLQEQAEKLNNKLVSLTKQKEKYNQTPMNSNDLSSIGNTTDNIIRKVLKWGLALFSIRSAYSFIRSSVSLLSQSNEQIGADIEYIRWALASTLQPIIETIINLAYTLLQYINYIANAWFGVNLFAKASAENFKKTKDGVKGVNTEAKKLQKTLAGFDEMNILQENGSTSAGGGGGGIGNIMPSTDLSQMLPDVEIPGWVKWIAENGDLIKRIIMDIGIAFGTWKILDLLNHLKLLGKGFDTFKQLLVTGGVMLIIMGVLGAIQDIQKLLGEGPIEMVWVWDLIENFGKIITGAGLVMAAFTGPAGWMTAAIGGAMTLLGWIGKLITKQNEEKDALDDSTESAKKLKTAKENLTKTSSDYSQAVKNSRDATQKLKDLEEKHKLSGEALFKSIQIGTKDVQSLTDEEYAVYQAYLDNKDAQTNLRDKTIELNKSQGDLRESTARLSGAVYQEKQAYDDNFKAIVEGFDGTQESVRNTQNYIFSMLGNMDDETKRVFIQNLPPEIAKAFEIPKDMIRVLSDKTEIAYKDIAAGANTTFGSNLPNAVKKSTNSISNLNALLSNTNTLFSKIGVKPLTVKVGGVTTGSAVGGIVTKLATGGIVNRPGRGVPVASSYMGEAGREGILPLTDSQAMETLGQAIGKYISLNATIPIYMGNRQIAREIQKIQAEDDFAYNGG